jgi:hypothetical protein
MLRFRSAILTLALLCGAGAAVAQDFTGSFSAPLGTGGRLALVLQQDAAGRITGTLTGNATFHVLAQVQNGQLTGYAITTAGRLYMDGKLQGGDLVLALAEVGPDGQPQVQTARTVTMMRSAVGQTAVPGSPSPGAPAGAQAGPASRGGDPYVGTFSSGEITVTLSRSQQGYTGSATRQGQQFPLVAQVAGDHLDGLYQVDGQSLPFQAVVKGDAMLLATNEGSFQLQRTAGAGAMGGGEQTGGLGAGQAGAVAATPQDRQVALLLLRSAWCSFKYNQTTGTSNTSRYVFRPDGTGSQGTGAETYSSGYGGTVAGQHQGGQQFRWRMQNGMLMFSQDGVNWEPQQLQVTQNSSGYPIIRAAGQEYSTCR